MTLDQHIAALVDMGAIPPPSVHLADRVLWRCVFFMGPAGSGKTAVRAKFYLKHLDFTVIDPDEIKVLNPDFDPEEPEGVHEWSKLMAEKKFIETVTSGCGASVLVEGSGKTWENTARKIWLAQALGYTTFLVYVHAPVEVSIYRNRVRGCAGDRFVDETVVLEQSKNAPKSYAKLMKLVDKYSKIEKFTNRDLEKAKANFAAFPPPQTENPLCRKTEEEGI